jgi:hypothetical protein
MQNENKKESKAKNLGYQIISNFIKEITGINIDNLSEEEEKAITTIIELISLHGSSMLVKIMAKAATTIGGEKTNETERVMKLWANSFHSKGQKPLVAIGLGSDCDLHVISPLEKRELMHLMATVLFDFAKSGEKNNKSPF